MFHRSERLLLRPGWLEDAPELAARIADEAIVRNLARVPWPYREEHARFWLSARNSPRTPAFLLTLPHEGGAPIIGSCGLHEGPSGDVEIGYWIAREWWGQGFATEAVRAVLSVACVLGHRRIHARHAVDNPASGRVLRKAGFAPSGRHISIFSEGRASDVFAAEYVAELTGCFGDDHLPPMPQAA